MSIQILSGLKRFGENAGKTDYESLTAFTFDGEEVTLQGADKVPSTAELWHFIGELEALGATRFKMKRRGRWKTYEKHGMKWHLVETRAQTKTSE